MPSLRLARTARRTTAHVAQSVEHLHGKQKVSGSIPLVGSITCFGRFALVGQSKFGISTRALAGRVPPEMTTSQHRRV